MLQGEHSEILSTFIRLSFVFKTFVLSIFEWLLKTGFTVYPQCTFKGECHSWSCYIQSLQYFIVYALKNSIWGMQAVNPEQTIPEVGGRNVIGKKIQLDRVMKNKIIPYIIVISSQSKEDKNRFSRPIIA